MLGVLNLQNLKMTDCEKMTENCNTWKMKDQITLCHLNIIIIYLVMEWQQQFNYSYLFDRQMASV